MRIRRWTIVFLVAATAVGVVAFNARQTRKAAREERLAAQQDVVADAARNAADIAFFEARIAADPQGAIDRTRIGALYMQRARESNNFQDYLRAEHASRSSLVLRTSRNSEAYAVLASALLAQHRFVEAREAARLLVAAAPAVDAYQSLLGEVCVELGDMPCAAEAFARISPAGRASLTVAPRLARWAEVRGDTATARRIFRAALNGVQRRADMPREQAAWFHLRAADLELRQGRITYAERALLSGLGRYPGDHRLLAAMARLRAAQHDWRGAIENGDSAIAVVLDPATLGLISDAYHALGDTARSAEYFTAMETAVGAQPGAYHRAWSMFLLDHGRRVAEVLVAAQTEIMSRPDIYGYDLLAWALFKSGRPREARDAIRVALAVGTQDPMLLYHAGMIERVAGDKTLARSYLRRALAISPWFDYAAPDAARAALDSLSRATSISWVRGSFIFRHAK